MAKTKPYGVRFDTELLKVLEEDGLAKTPQQAVNYLSSFWAKQSKIVNFEEKYGDFFKRMEAGIQDLTKSNVEIKPKEAPKSNFKAYVPKKEESAANEEKTVSGEKNDAPEAKAPQTFGEFLSMAKTCDGYYGEILRQQVADSKLTPNQKSMVLSKIKNQIP